MHTLALLARSLANNSSPFPPHARAASANGVVTRHDDRGAELFIYRRRNGAADRASANASVDFSMAPSAARWQHLPFHFQFAVSFLKRAARLMILSGGAPLHTGIINYFTRLRQMLLSKKKQPVFADIPNPLTRLKDKNLHRPPAAGHFTHRISFSFFLFFGLGLAGAESCGLLSARKNISIKRSISGTQLAGDRLYPACLGA